MKQLQFFKLASLVLLLLNAGILLFFWLQRPPRAPGMGGAIGSFETVAIDLLQLDESQAADFQNLAIEHGTRIHAFNQEQNRNLQQYFSTVYRAGDLLLKDSLIMQVEQLEQQKVQFTYQHFEDVRALLRPEQLPQFEVFVTQAVGRLLRPEKKGGLHRRIE